MNEGGGGILKWDKEKKRLAGLMKLKGITSRK